MRGRESEPHCAGAVTALSHDECGESRGSSQGGLAGETLRRHECCTTRRRCGRDIHLACLCGRAARSKRSRSFDSFCSYIRGQFAADWRDGEATDIRGMPILKMPIPLTSSDVAIYTVYLCGRCAARARYRHGACARSHLRRSHVTTWRGRVCVRVCGPAVRTRTPRVSVTRWPGLVADVGVPSVLSANRRGIESRSSPYRVLCTYSRYIYTDRLPYARYNCTG